MLPTTPSILGTASDKIWDEAERANALMGVNSPGMGVICCRIMLRMVLEHRKVQAYYWYDSEEQVRLFSVGEWLYWDWMTMQMNWGISKVPVTVIVELVPSASKTYNTGITVNLPTAVVWATVAGNRHNPKRGSKIKWLGWEWFGKFPKLDVIYNPAVQLFSPNTLTE
jgi:hypothetical protein